MDIVWVGIHTIGIKVDSGACITICGGFELDRGGRVARGSAERAPQEASPLLSLVRTQVRNVLLDEDSGLILGFSDGATLRVCRDLQGFESFQVSIPDEKVIAF